MTDLLISQARHIGSVVKVWWVVPWLASRLQDSKSSYYTMLHRFVMKVMTVMMGRRGRRGRMVRGKRCMV
jgi:hypothetical protein